MVDIEIIYLFYTAKDCKFSDRVVDLIYKHIPELIDKIEFVEMRDQDSYTFNIGFLIDVPYIPVLVVNPKQNKIILKGPEKIASWIMKYKNDIKKPSTETSVDIVGLKKRLAEAEKASTCQICVTNPRELFFSTCGHSVCETCYSHIFHDSLNCPFCRKRIRENSVHKMYL